MDNILQRTLALHKTNGLSAEINTGEIRSLNAYFTHFNEQVVFKNLVIDWLISWVFYLVSQMVSFIDAMIYSLKKRTPTEKYAGKVKKAMKAYVKEEGYDIEFATTRGSEYFVSNKEIPSRRDETIWYPFLIVTPAFGAAANNLTKALIEIHELSHLLLGTRYPLMYRSSMNKETRSVIYPFEEIVVTMVMGIIAERFGITKELLTEDGSSQPRVVEYFLEGYIMNHLLCLKNAKEKHLSDIKGDESSIVSLIRLYDEDELLKMAHREAKFIVEDFDKLIADYVE